MFKIGEFSKIAQVSGRLLRYYNEIGLFKPQYSEPETGYRYYSADQLPRLNRVLALKELGLSLEQIQRLLKANIGPEDIRHMYLERKAQLEQSLREELARLQQVQLRLQQLERPAGVFRAFDDALTASWRAFDILSASRKDLPGWKE